MSFDEDTRPEGRFNLTKRAKGETYDAERDIVRGIVETGPGSGYPIIENLRTGVVLHHANPPNNISYSSGTDLGPAYETDGSHTKACQKRSRIADNQGYCFCPVDNPSSMVEK